jgi:hypothetical protein
MNNIITLQPLTSFEAISLLVSIVGFAAVILTLLFMRRQTSAMITQTKSGTDSLKSSAYQSCATQMFTVDAVFVKHPELHRYFYSGEDVSEGDPAYERVIAICELFLDYIDSVLTQEEQLPDFWPIDRWEQYFIDIFSSSPALCRYLNLTRGWYPDKIIQLMEAGERARIQKNSHK